MKKRSEMRVLVVDDFAVMRKIVKNLLIDIGYQNIDEADDGETAWPMIKTGSYDMILSDWNMPKVTGIELLKLSKNLDKKRNVLTPFILITAEQKRSQILEAAQAGVDSYIVKPFTSESLSKKIKLIEDRYEKLKK